MADVQVALTAEERACLVELLQTALKDARVEEHRTRTPTYRENVLNKEKLMAAVLSKLAQQPKSATP